MKIVSWNDIKSSVKKANPKLFDLLDHLDLALDEDFVLAEYQFGQHLVKNGRWFLPLNHDQLVPFDSLELSPPIKARLSNKAYPVGMILTKTAEVYYETTERVITDKVWRQGTVFGVWEYFDESINKNSTQASNVTAGVRTMFMLPKISDWLSFNRLKKEFNLTSSPPEGLKDQHQIFTELVQKAPAGEVNWKTTVLLFSEKLLKKIFSISGRDLKFYFLNEAWTQSYNCRRQFENNLSWEECLRVIASDGHLHPRLCAHLKQLLLIYENVFPGMVFASEGSEDLAPVAFLQRVYQDVYRLKGYAPILMHPDYLANAPAVYYSLNFPSYFDTHFPVKSIARLMEELSLIKKVIDKIKPDVGLRADSMQYFHSMAQGDSDILSSEELKAIDSTLAHYFSSNQAREFPGNAAFFKGCIRITK